MEGQLGTKDELVISTVLRSKQPTLAEVGCNLYNDWKGLLGAQFSAEGLQHILLNSAIWRYTLHYGNASLYMLGPNEHAWLQVLRKIQQRPVSQKIVPESLLRLWGQTLKPRMLPQKTLPRCTEPLSVHFQQPCSHRATVGHTIPVRDPSKFDFEGGIWCWMTMDHVGCWMLLNAFGEKMWS